MQDLRLMATLWPTFPHFKEFANDPRLCGIRLNSAMVKVDELGDLLQVAQDLNCSLPLYFDIKGNQLRVVEDYSTEDHLEIEINHPIEVKTPASVIFKAGEDVAILKEVKDRTRLVFEGGPKYLVFPNESLHIRDPSLKVYGPTFIEQEIAKIEKAKKAGFNKFFLSYTQSQRDVDEFRELVGDSAEVVLKIEDKNGLSYVADKYKKQENTWLLAARGDLFVEVERPHQITEALRLIINKDPEAGIGSRILLSLIQKEYYNKLVVGKPKLDRNGRAMIDQRIILNPVPSAADISDIAWLYDIGYRKIMLCDEICLQADLLETAINVIDELKGDYNQGVHFRPANFCQDFSLEERTTNPGRLSKTNPKLYRRGETK